MFHVPEKFRIRVGAMASDESDGNNGCFELIRHMYKGKTKRYTMNVIASDGMGWEHVSVSLPTRAPTWEEMCWVKSLFWDREDCVMQLHPPESEWVNNHPHCLHLWRPVSAEIPRPPMITVGMQELNL